MDDKSLCSDEYSARFSDKPCEQRKDNGDPCTSRALRGERLCHYHKVMGPPPIDIDNDEHTSRHVYLPQVEDAVSIQSAISEVYEMMLRRRIEPREATALFYAMQVASANMVFLNARSQRSNSETKTVPSSRLQTPAARNHSGVRAAAAPQTLSARLLCGENQLSIRVKDKKIKNEIQK